MSVGKARNKQKNPATVIIKFRSMNDPEMMGSMESQTRGEAQLTSGHSEVKTDLEFQELFQKRLNDRSFNWKTVEYVQTCIKADPGIGKHIMVHFFAPLDDTTDTHANAEIHYKYDHLPDGLWLLQNEQYMQYCQK